MARSAWFLARSSFSMNMGEVVMEKKRDCRNPSTHKEYIIISSSKKNDDYDYDYDQ